MEDRNRLIKETAERLGFKLVELDINEKFKKIRIIIYKKTGVAIEDCEKLTRELVDDIEFNDMYRSDYNLEVSSPGVARNFKSIKEYDIFSGKEVKIISNAAEEDKVYIGILKGIDSKSNILIENEYDLFKIPYVKIKKGCLLFDKL